MTGVLMNWLSSSLLTISSTMARLARNIHYVVKASKIWNGLPGPMGVLTTSSGGLVEEQAATRTLNTNLIENIYFLENLTHFDRERIPERVVHAKGNAAFGYFEVTHDISKYCKARLFETIGKKTPVAARFSTVTRELGSADTVREPRGYAVKFYTEDGIWDLVALSTPVFFVRDPIFFMSLIHALKRNPATNLPDPTMMWDFVTLRPETVHAILFIFSDRGIPDGYRYMNGFGIHTFELVNAMGTSYYVRFHLVTDQGIRNLSSEAAAKLAGEDPDYAGRDLYNAIAKDDHPSWTLYIQKMSVDAVRRAKFDPFDVTKVWPHGEYPLKPVGRLCFNRNPVNYFAEAEQLAFNPADLVPGILGGRDKIYESRLISYRDTQYHRLGPNFQQIPVNCPMRSIVKNYNRDGYMTVNMNQKDAPNYFPNSFNGPIPYVDRNKPQQRIFNNSDMVDDFTQPCDFYLRVLNDDERGRLIDNLVTNLGSAAAFIQDRAVDLFKKVHPDLGERVAQGLRQSSTKL